MVDDGNVSKKLILWLAVLGSIVVLLGLVLTETIKAGLDAREAALNPDGFVHELFRDTQGKLWISDYIAGEVWRVDPDTGAYTVYENLLGASDGRIDSGGKLWWTDLEGGSLGRYFPGAGSATVWSLGLDAGPLGMAFDNSGTVWVTDAVEPNLYKFDRPNLQLCTYPMPNDGNADYILFRSGYLWMGDSILGRIVRFNISNNNFRIWQLPAGAEPQGLAIDGSGRLWYADVGLGELGRIDPSNNQLRRYAIPALSGPPAEPVMVDFDAGKVWYTNLIGSVGRLDPANASSTATTISPSSSTASPSCSAAGIGTTVTVSTRGGTLGWTGASYPLIHSKNGWMIYKLPVGASPWGVTASGSDIWFNDQGTIGLRAQTLGWMHFTEDPTPTRMPTNTSTVTPGPSPTASDTPAPSVTPAATSEPPLGDHWIVMPVIISDG